MKEQGIKDAEENGILKLVKKNAESLITGFVKTNEEFNDYNIVKINKRGKHLKYVVYYYKVIYLNHQI